NGHDIYIAQYTDALIYSGSCRGNGQRHQNGHDQDLIREAGVGHNPENLESGIDLYNSEPKGGGNPEEGAAKGKNVDRIPPGAVDLLFEQRVKTATKRKWQIITIGKVGKGQTNEGIDSPGVNSPMKKGIELCTLSAAYDMIGSKYFRGIMLHRLGYSKIHQSDTHSCCKQHRDPRKKRKFGSAVITSQPDRSISAEHQVGQKNHKDGYRPHIHPVQVHEDEVFYDIKKVFGK